MGRPKQLLPCPSQFSASPMPMVAVAGRGLLQFCSEIVIAIGHEAERVRAAIRDHLPAGQCRFIEVDPEAPMFNSIVCGLNEIRSDRLARHGADLNQSDSKRHSTAVLLHPADHPVVNRSTVEKLIETWWSTPEQAVLPEHDGRGGHPILIPVTLIDKIASDNGEGGLRNFWMRNPQNHLRIAVSDAAVVRDLDDERDYQIYLSSHACLP